MPQNELRPALYHRFHRLLPFIAHPAAHRLWRVLFWGFWFVYFAFVLIVLALRYSVLPNIENYRGDIERLASRALGQAVSIGQIEASWEGINPDLTLSDVRIADTQGRPALAFSRVETILSWWSIPQLQLQLRLLRIDEPTLHLRREPDGRIFIAGIPLNPGGSDSDVSDWVLAQRRIRIRGATVVWEDALRGAPPLLLEDLNFALDNRGSHHRFGLTALPPPEMAAKIDLRGDFRGRDLDELESWKGQIFSAIDYADLAVWRNWVDYPVDLPHGRGALRAWASFAGGALRELTADLALEAVGLRLTPELPAIELDHLAGRLAARFSANGFELEARRIELATRALSGVDAAATILVEPTDFQLSWQPEVDGKTVRGKATASEIDLLALARLAAYLPLDVGTRQLLADYAPRGRLSELRTSWRGDVERLQAYSLNTRFDGVALKAREGFPGFSGLSGSFDASEKGGSAVLHSQGSTIDLPRIFPESPITLDSLNAQAKWAIAKGVVDAELIRADFASKDAAGSAQGSYRHTGSGPGSIDLTATLTRADARSVWRYMPRVVSANARSWLRDSLRAGTSSEAKLILKGDLANFPFRDKKTGQFLVTVKAGGVTLDYANGWPKITDISGDIRFEGAGMLVEAKRGTILGAQLAATRVEIPDFDAQHRVLSIKGRADGPTAEFLKFIDQSPVAARIDHFTEDMRASGQGRLDLALAIPLDAGRLDDTKVAGSYQFLANEVTVDPDLPPLRRVNGSLQFSEKDLQIPEVKATLFGGPLRISGSTQADGKVLINAEGSVTAVQLRDYVNLPLLSHLSGSTAYRGEVRVKKRSADLLISSDLLGLASTLPEPFGKSAGQALALRFEKASLPASSAAGGETLARDELSASLGNAAAMRLVRQKKAGVFAVERGAIAIGRPLPSGERGERGVLLTVAAQKLDLDFWRQAMSSKVQGNAGGAAEMPLSAVDIKATELDLLGRRYHNVELGAVASGALWQIRLAAREASGDLQWDSAARGKLTAKLKHLLIEPVAGEAAKHTGETLEELPALDVIADDFAIGKRHFGRLEMQAHNIGQDWRLDRVLLANPFGTLSASGQWQTAGGNRTRLDFKLDSSNAGKLLERLGYPGALRGGATQMAGRVSWNGSPAELDYGSLGGELTIDVASGQFVKLDPGAGKLLGLISLQSLPRRITLDFRDVFSEGFAFDSISGKLRVEQGRMLTDRLQIDGPAARVVMRGEADLQRETQRLTVNVQPDFGGTAALGVALVNPLAGLATLLAHKALQSPLNRMFGFEYLVSGTWDDPKVEKLSRVDPPPIPTPRLPTIANPPGVANDSIQQ